MVTLLRPNRILLTLTPNNRRAVLQKLATHIALDLGRPLVGIHDILTSPFETHLTALGRGAVVIDSLAPELDQPYLLLARLAHPVMFADLDHQPIDLCAVLFSSDQNRAHHLQSIAWLVRKLQDPHLLAAWRGAGSVDAVRAIFMPDSSTARAA